MMSTFLGRSIVAAVVVTALAAPAVAQEAKAKPVRFKAFAVNLGSGPNAGTVDIVLERLSSDEERANLLATFVEGGQDKLLTALQKVKPRAGYRRSSWRTTASRRSRSRTSPSRGRPDSGLPQTVSRA